MMWLLLITTIESGRVHTSAEEFISRAGCMAAATEYVINETPIRIACVEVKSSPYPGTLTRIS